MQNSILRKPLGVLRRRASFVCALPAVSVFHGIIEMIGNGYQIEVRVLDVKNVADKVGGLCFAVGSLPSTLDLVLIQLDIPFWIFGKVFLRVIGISYLLRKISASSLTNTAWKGNARAMTFKCFS
jgi:hypothetical protein